MRNAVLIGKSLGAVAKLLKSEDFVELLKLDSVPAIAGYLKDRTSYGDILKPIDVSEIHRRELEVLLRKKSLNDVYRFYGYLDMNSRKIARMMGKRFEIENLKMILRSKHTRTDISMEKFYPVLHPELDLEELLKIETMDETIEKLKGTSYGRILESSMHMYKDLNLVSVFENALDTWYFTELERIMMVNPRFSRVRRFLRMQKDLFNIQWIFRARLIFKLGRNEIMGFLIPTKDAEMLEIFDELSKAKGMNDFIEKLSRTKYSRITDVLKSSKLPIDFLFSRVIYRFMWEEAKKLLHNMNDGLHSFIGYAHLKEFEFMDLVSIIEGIRYRMEMELVSEYLINPIG